MRHEQRQSPPSRSFSCLSLERLEVREVPALVTWVGDNNTFNEADNWSPYGIPTSNDILLFTGPQSPPPVPPPPGFPPLLPAPPYSHQSVIFPTTADLSYAGIRLLNSYAGTVTFPANVSFGEYTQNSGYTSQYADIVVSISTTFGWVGGSINTSTNNATYKLLAVLNGQIGEDSTSLNTGSKLVVDRNGVGLGSYVRQAGILNLLNDADIEVKQDCELDQRRINIGTTGPKILGDGTIYLDMGRLSSDGGVAPAVLIEGGNLTVKPDGMEVTKKVAGTNWGVMMLGGVINIKNGTTLKATNGVYVDGGDLLTTGAINPVPQEAKIEGALRFYDGRIILGTGDDTTYSTLWVTDRVELIGGTFLPKVNATNATEEDNIRTDEEFDCFTTFEISPQELNGQAPVNTRWTILWSTAANGFVDNTDPTLIAAAQANFALTRGGTTNELYLDRK